MTIKQHILNFLDAIDRDAHQQIVRDEIKAAYTEGKKLAKVHWRVIPLPFDEATLAGANYGTFITPVGFATTFGECNVPAPSQHGYEQRAGYVMKEQLVNGFDITVYPSNKFDSPEDSDALVPVIVTVLR